MNTFEQADQKKVRPMLIVGLDFGQAVDAAALSAITLDEAGLIRLVKLWGGSGLKYPEVAARMDAILRTFTPSEIRGPYIFGESNGPGVVVLDDLEACGWKSIRRVTTRGGVGDTRDHDRGLYSVSKERLLSGLLVEIESRGKRFVLPSRKKMPEVAVLIAEFQEYQTKMTESGTIVYGARSGRHDDYVMATAIVVWAARMVEEERRKNQTPPPASATVTGTLPGERPTVHAPAATYSSGGVSRTLAEEKVTAAESTRKWAAEQDELMRRHGLA